MASPLAQFEIKSYYPLELMGVDISFTNSSLAMLTTSCVIIFFMYMGVRNSSIIPSRLQVMLEISYEFIGNMINDNIGKEGMKYFSFIFTLFMFILLGNLIGMMPYSFTWTSHIIVTFTLSFFIFVAVTLIAIAKHGLIKFLKLLPVPDINTAIFNFLFPINFTI